MITGTFKQKNGTELGPRTQAKSVLVQIGDDTYTLAEVLSAIMQDPVESVSASRDEDIAANTDYTVPEYIVGCANISVYLNGLKVSCGSNGGFVEVGTQDSLSTTIQFLDTVAKDVEIIVRVGR